MRYMDWTKAKSLNVTALTSSFQVAVEATMAKMLLLAAVLGTLLSFQGASGYCGWHITPAALETCKGISLT